MARIHLEGAVVCPEVNGRRNARYTSLVNHLRRLSTAYRELEIGIFLPVSEEERELPEEAVVHVAHQLNSRRARVACDAALEIRGASDERLPSLEVVFVFYLRDISHGLL